MDLPSFRQLLSPAGQDVLRAALALEPREPDFLRHFQVLCRTFPAEIARPALETAILRREAAQGGKFLHPEGMYFTRAALEQATAHPVATYRAERMRGFARAVDLGCSIGSDSLALAQVLPVTGLDLDPLRLNMARANAAACPASHPVLFSQADLTSPLPVRPDFGTALFFDPARRDTAGRIYATRDYQPPLDVVRNWLPEFPHLCVKLSPGVKINELRAYDDAGLEFISLRGELKEAVLWFGELRRAKRQATLLPGGHSLNDDDPAPPPSLSKPLAIFYEPDPAVLRAGLVAALAYRLNAAQVDPDIAYLTAEQEIPTPFARAWTVCDWFPFQLKRLRAYLRERSVGRVTVKKRGSPLEPEALIHDLRLKGEQERTIFLTHADGDPIVVVCLP